MDRMRIATAAAFGTMFAIGCASVANAHGMRTAYVEIVEQTPGRAVAHFRATIDAPVKIRFPPECDVESVAPTMSTNPLVHGGSTLVLQCKGSLAGREIGVEGLGTTITEAVVWVSRSDGATSSHLLTPAEATFRIPSQSRPLARLTEYVPLGMKHILAGADHLLFLLLLVFTLRRPKAVLWAETAFTLSHALSFSAAALGWIHVSKEAAEACIAASLLLLALDVERKGLPAPSTRAGASLALVFGLVHGLGFAGGLSELGMPSQDVGWALVGFAAGVEIGQVLFLVVALLISYLLSRSRFYFQTTFLVAYAAGGFAAFWFIERVIECLGVARSIW